jgi:hypothetical protein
MRTSFATAERVMTNHPHHRAPASALGDMVVAKSR